MSPVYNPPMMFRSHSNAVAPAAFAEDLEGPGPHHFTSRDLPEDLPRRPTRCLRVHSSFIDDEAREDE